MKCSARGFPLLTHDRRARQKIAAVQTDPTSYFLCGYRLYAVPRSIHQRHHTRRGQIARPGEVTRQICSRHVLGERYSGGAGTAIGLDVYESDRTAINLLLSAMQSRTDFVGALDV